MQVLKKAAEKKELVQVALNTHGTRAVQKLIETLTTREQVPLLEFFCLWLLESCWNQCSSRLQSPWQV